MRDNRTSHLPPDLADLYGAVESRVLGIARQMGSLTDPATPEASALWTEFAEVSDALRTLEDPECGDWERDWVRNRWAGVDVVSTSPCAAPASPAAHLPADLAQLHDALTALQAETSQRLLAMDEASPEYADLQMSAGMLDEHLAALRDPEASAYELGDVGNMWSGVPTSFDAWTASPAAEADASELELEAAL